MAKREPKYRTMKTSQTAFLALKTIVSTRPGVRIWKVLEDVLVAEWRRLLPLDPKLPKVNR